MTKLHITSSSAVLEPSTTTSATAAFARFVDSTALGTPVTGACRGYTHRGWFCDDTRMKCYYECSTMPSMSTNDRNVVYGSNRDNHFLFKCTKHNARTKKVSPQLTFAGLNALGPCMIKLHITSSSAVLEPSTTTSATAAFTG